ncbi:hypothetical protein HKX48_008893 [Thoreauomyces humboldtii]|nr:hypothetical protein HKX48_008893 [Thoreauomyces humboldtii]
MIGYVPDDQDRTVRDQREPIGFTHDRLTQETQKLYLYCQENKPYNRPSDYIKFLSRDHSAYITAEHRAVLVDWMRELAFQFFGNCSETFQLSVSFLDRYCSVRPYMIARYQRLGAACFLVASKCAETSPPTFRDLAQMSGGAFTPSSLQETELSVLQVLKWHLTGPTPHMFLDYYLAEFPGRNPEELFRLRRIALRWINASQRSYDMIRFRPSVQAAAALKCACRWENYTEFQKVMSTELDKYATHPAVLVSNVIVPRMREVDTCSQLMIDTLGWTIPPVYRTVGTLKSSPPEISKPVPNHAPKTRAPPAGKPPGNVPATRPTLPRAARKAGPVPINNVAAPKQPKQAAPAKRLRSTRSTTDTGAELKSTREAIPKGSTKQSRIAVPPIDSLNGFKSSKPAVHRDAGLSCARHPPIATLPPVSSVSSTIKAEAPPPQHRGSGHPSVSQAHEPCLAPAPQMYTGIFPAQYVSWLSQLVRVQNFPDVPVWWPTSLPFAPWGYVCKHIPPGHMTAAWAHYQEYMLYVYHSEAQARESLLQPPLPPPPPPPPRQDTRRTQAQVKRRASPTLESGGPQVKRPRPVYPTPNEEYR